MSQYTITANFVDLFQRTVYPAEVTVEGGIIKSVSKTSASPEQFLLPGFVDAHVHIESSMLVPSAFARLAVVHGTVATVSDPHEIANVCGAEGVRFMIENSKQTPLKVFFGAPSCVPATVFETAGATLDAQAVGKLLADKDIWYLAEMMNYPGVLHRDEEVMAKIAAAKAANKPIDGHAPGLRGNLVEQYADAGITTDHESFTLEEATDKVKYGMYCLIREGSAARNFDALIEIIRTHPYAVMFCSDDKHPDELVLHHINDHVRRAVKLGYDLYDVLRAACMNPVVHYGLPIGLLRKGDPADFILVKDLSDFEVLATYISGIKVAEHGKSLLPHIPVSPINNFKANKIETRDLEVPAAPDVKQVRVIDAIEGQLVTNESTATPVIKDGCLVSDVQQDVLKIAVINRYENTVKPAVAFIRNFGLKRGALASTVAHDCHNIIVVGADDASMVAAVNALVEAKGGISVALGKDEVHCMPLPVAGLMTDKDGYEVAREYSLLDKMAKEQLGTPLKAPFMTLSFMALLVIPALKLSDKGLFDGAKFQFADLQIKA